MSKNEDWDYRWLTCPNCGYRKRVPGRIVRTSCENCKNSDLVVLPQRDALERKQALGTVVEFIYQVIRNGDHIHALENMDCSDEAFIEDLEMSDFFRLLPELREVFGVDDKL